jgi:hypothetical protein
VLIPKKKMHNVQQKNVKFWIVELGKIEIRDKIFIRILNFSCHELRIIYCTNRQNLYLWNLEQQVTLH